MPSTTVQSPPRQQTADLPAYLADFACGGWLSGGGQCCRLERVILFGSVARGEATPDSDIDILVVAATVGSRSTIRLATARRSVRDLRYGLPISPLVLTPEEMQERLERRDPFITEIIATGIEL